MIRAKLLKGCIMLFTRYIIIHHKGVHKINYTINWMANRPFSAYQNSASQLSLQDTNKGNCLCPLGFIIKLNFNISKVTYYLVDYPICFCTGVYPEPEQVLKILKYLPYKNFIYEDVTLMSRTRNVLKTEDVSLVIMNNETWL